ncbi:MAG: antibiotic biosynthesis monooxygenase [Lysobacteraceae bacterium]|nr:MAG: antibiotic biosynthesis monooxygenase [Xanthomonadaceae bacterium]
MIHEMASILVKQGMGGRFEQGFLEALPLFKRAKGCHGARLERSVEDPLRYLVIVGWETLEDHVVGFRNSEDYGRWRDLVGAFFATPPSVDHTKVVIDDRVTEEFQ